MTSLAVFSVVAAVVADPVVGLDPAVGLWVPVIASVAPFVVGVVSRWVPDRKEARKATAVGFAVAVVVLSLLVDPPVAYTPAVLSTRLVLAWGVGEVVYRLLMGVIAPGVPVVGRALKGRELRAPEGGYVPPGDGGTVWND